MRVEFLDREMVDSDLGVVNAARCSFDKESQWIETKRTLDPSDIKLIHYLAKHQHWTPFAHAQNVFQLILTDSEALRFLLEANLSGFEFLPKKCPSWWVRGSLYAWVTNIKYLPQDIKVYIMAYLCGKYTWSVAALTRDNPLLCSDKTCHRVIYSPAFNDERLSSITIRLHVPIFVKRQLETHRRNFVMTNIEDFSQNEVSRRYVDSKPEIYFPKEWRLQAEDKKQGSSDLTLTGIEEHIVGVNYYATMYNTKQYYERMNTSGVAHEQSRMILPLSTYTTFWWTGSLKSWKRMLNLRLDSHTQSETRDVAQLCYEAIKHEGYI